MKITCDRKIVRINWVIQVCITQSKNVRRIWFKERFALSKIWTKPCIFVKLRKSENICSCIIKVTGQVWERQKRISINTNHSYHQHSYSYTSLNWFNKNFRFSLSHANRKRQGARLVNVIKHLPHKVFSFRYLH